MLRGIAGSIALAAACTALLSACHKEDTPKLDDEQQVRATLARFGTASARRDYPAVCRDLLADTLVAKIRSVGISCEVAIRTGLSDVKKPTLTVTSVRVQGSTATAAVRSTAKGQKPSTDLVRLVKQRGGWRLASLAEPEPSEARGGRTPTRKSGSRKPGSKQADSKKAAPKKAAPKKAAPKKASPKNAAPKKASPRKAAPTNADPKKAATDGS